MKQITKYQCDFCKRSYVSKYKAREHEKICFFNPANKSCVTCKNKDIKEILDSEGYPVDAVSWCEKMNRKIFREGCVIKDCEGWEEDKESEVGKDE